jgi:hypothetical protein
MIQHSIDASTEPLVERVSRHLAEEIAEQTDTPIEVVQDLYDREFQELVAQARITQYVSVIAGRRVKLRLLTH